jgi:hypothetical protein
MSEQLEPLPQAVRHMAAAFGQDSYALVEKGTGRFSTGPGRPLEK